MDGFSWQISLCLHRRATIFAAAVALLVAASSFSPVAAQDAVWNPAFAGAPSAPERLPQVMAEPPTSFSVAAVNFVEAAAPISPMTNDELAERIVTLESQIEKMLAGEEKDDDGDDKTPSYLMPLSGDCGDITFKPGARIQTRYTYDDLNNNNDIFIRRFRLKGSGDVFGLAKYGTELKIDSTGKFQTAPAPTPVVENAWLDFELLDDLTYLRVGLYDAPFSRNALTSDSKLLFMDRSLVYDTLSALGFTDNTIGLLFHGRPLAGRFEYDLGIFDNQKFERFLPSVVKDSNQLMPAGRIMMYLLDPAPSASGYADYQGSYIGKGQRLDLGANFAYLGSAVDGATEGDLNAWGVDLFFNTGPITLQAEYDRYMNNMTGGAADVHGDGWYVQGGYLLNQCRYLSCPCSYALELAARYQSLDANSNLPGDRLDWTSIGMNIYFRDHNLKLQTDYTFKREQVVELDNDLFQIQLQFDY